MNDSTMAPAGPQTDTIAPRILSAIDFPPVVLIDTVNFCNARCPFCPLFQGDSPMDRSVRPTTTMPQELFERIVCEMSRWEQPPQSIAICPNAEILSDPQLIARLDALRRYGMAKVTTLMTNGQFLSERVAQAILDSGIFQVMPGFDGASKEVYEAHRVRCNYERVLTNIRNFVRLRNASSSKTRITLKFVRTPRNDHEVVAAYNLFNEFLDPELDRFNDALATEWSNTASSSEDLYYYPKLKQGRRLGRCNYYEGGLMIQADGKIGACCWDYNLTISDGGLGDANETPLLDIWRGQKRVALQDAFLACDDNIPDACQTCMMIYEWEPIPHDLVRFDEDIIEGRGPTSFMCLFRGPAQAGQATNAVSGVESIVSQPASTRTGVPIIRGARGVIRNLARSLKLFS